MRKLLLSAATFVLSVACANAAVGDDLTSKYLKNADFSQTEPVQYGITTYGKDMSGAGTIYNGMQAVDAWTACNPSDNGSANDDNRDGRASGVYAVGKTSLADFTGNEDDAGTEIFLGGVGYLAPYTNANDGDEGNLLGIISVWGLKAQYTQTVTLAPGAYTIEFPIYNGGGTGEVGSNLFGFIADNGTSYMCENKTFTVGVWETVSVNFILTETTSGVISLGFNGPGGSGAMPHLFLDCVRIIEADATDLDREQAEKLKPLLLEVLEAGDELNADTEAGWAVYNDNNATLAQVEAAIEKQKQINATCMTDFTDFFINNAHFAYGEPADCGVCTYDYDMPVNETKRYGMQPIQDWIANTPTDNTQVSADKDHARTDGLNAGAAGLFAVGSPENVWLGSKGDVVPQSKANGSTEGNVFGFISVWSKTSYYYQNVTLPAGSYTITIPTYNERGTGAVAKNLCGFIADDGTEYLAETTTFPVGVWTNETIKFNLDEEVSGKITIGYQATNAGSGSMPHLFIDEFTLMFNGKTDIAPSLLALQGAIRSAEKYVYAYDENPYEAQLVSDLESVIAKGSDLVSAGSSDDTKNTNAATAINNKIDQVKTSIEAYKKFRTFLDTDVEKAIAKYGEGDTQTLADELSDLLNNEYEEGYEEGKFSAVQINEIMNGFQAYVAAGIQKILDAAVAKGGECAIDITALFADKNLDYAKSTVDGWQNETGTSAFLSRVQTAEVWNQSNFNVYQTLTDLPAGIYEIQVPAFYRESKDADNYDAYVGNLITGSAYVYANNSRTLLHNQAEYAGDEASYRNRELVEGEGVWVPASNDCAHYFFYDQEDDDVTNTVTTALAKQGDLVIGMQGENLIANEGCWVVWGGFSVIYKGTAGMESVLYDEIQQLVVIATDLDGEVSTQSTAASTKLNDAIGQSESVSASSSLEALTACANELTDAIAYARQTAGLIEKIGVLYTTYADYIMEGVESSEESYPTMMSEVYAALNGEGFESNEAIEDYMGRIQKEFTAYVQYDGLASASETAPYDMSAAIINAGFEGVSGEPNADYWTVTTDGGNKNYDSGIYECYNNTSFNVSQTIPALAKGYYKVRVQAFYRAGNGGDNAKGFYEKLDSVNNVTFYAQTATTSAAYLLKNQIEKFDADGYITATEMVTSDTDGELTVAYGEYVDEEGAGTYYVPNVRSVLADYFSMGAYWNEIIVQVANDGDDLTIGLKKDIHIGADWCPYDNFELYYLGTTKPADADKYTTGVESVMVQSQPAVKAIYSINGQQLSRMQKGINIVRKADGKVVKVLVK